MTPYFHLAFPVDDLDAARGFYSGVLGCREGRSDPKWVDFDLYGHQIVAHLQPAAVGDRASSAVDGHGVPIPHFGLIMEMADWRELAQRLRDAGSTFVIEPYVRFEGLPGEQATMFVRDPAGNALEFKAFNDMSQVFAK
ncbi:MAG: VOC family protein [Gemmatimonadota bacterium]|nr:VOC family protein [Gemmatimonadota bacterium]